ncbi:MAG TPA: AMP-binding protein [Mycobacterium sp.]|nr:AMP-binding protein [Mycobacterium sp.]
MMESSILTVLRERASLKPNNTAFTFIDYERDWLGVAQSLTWSQLYRRVQNVAAQLSVRGSIGDRAVILAPQGLDYIAAFFGAMQAGRIAVPLSLPTGGAHDERVISVLRDASPAAILTTSFAVGDVSEYAKPQSGESAPSVIEVDLLGEEARKESNAWGDRPSVAYLQYTSGSTRQPAGVMISHKNLRTNIKQIVSDYFVEYGKVAPPDTTIVSWLPFYHDMGLIVGTCIPILAGLRAVLTSPTSFLQRPARWMQLLASNGRAWSAAPNFAFDLAARKTSDDDMAGLDLGDVLHILNGSERVQPATVKQFAERFARFNLQPKVVRPSYGLAESTVYVVTPRPGDPSKLVHFDAEKLSVGQAERCAGSDGTPLFSYGVPESPTVRIVDRETLTECPAGTVGEIWVHGANVAMGYWQNPQLTERTFGATLVAAPAGTPEEAWLRTGDLGFFFDGELFIVGRDKDLLVVYGRNHYPDDIEATIQEITGGRTAAIAVPDGRTEKLVAIVELKKRGDSHEEVMDRLGIVKREVTSAISRSHGLHVADLVLVAPGSLPITTSGKVRRAACVEQYRNRQFTRIDH